MMTAMKQILRDNWYLAVLVVILITAAALLSVFPKAKVPSKTAAQIPNIAEPITASDAPVQPQPVRPTEKESAQKTIGDLQDEFNDDPKSADAPALLNAMANLNRQKLLNYQEAARLYELLLMDYPEWDGIAKIYPQLATCYERAGDHAGERSVYRRMIEKFTPDTQEYLYAKYQLGI